MLKHYYGRFLMLSISDSLHRSTSSAFLKGFLSFLILELLKTGSYLPTMSEFFTSLALTSSI